MGYEGWAVTDRNSLAGAVRAHVAAKKIGQKLVIGAEIRMNDAGPVLLWAIDRGGYGRLCRLLTLGRRQAPKGECRLGFADVAEHAEGLLAGVLLAHSADLAADLPRWRSAFPDRIYAVAELHRGPDDDRRLERWRRAARAAGVPMVAAGDVHYHHPRRRYLQDVLTAIRLKTTVAELGSSRFPNGERSLRPLDEILRVFDGDIDVIARSAEVADRCAFSLDELRYQYPEELCPPGETPLSYLARLAWAGARDRYPDGVPSKVADLIERELKIIEELDYPAYFLTVWDLVRFARERGILCQGRGLGGQLGGLLLPGGHLGRSRPNRRPVRAIPVEGPRRGPRHRHRFRARAPRGGDPVYLREIRPRPRRHDRRADHVSPALGRPGRRQGAGAVAGSGRPPGRCPRPPRQRRDDARPPARGGARPFEPDHPAVAPPGPRDPRLPAALSQHVGGMS